MLHRRVSLSEAGASYALVAGHSAVERAAIFVHGLGGSAVETWLKFQELLDCEERPDIADWWQDTDAFFYAYQSTRFGIAEHASALAEFIQRVFPDPTEILAPISAEVLDAFGDASSSWRKGGARNVHGRYRELFLVGHSLGAVVLREAIWKLAFHAKQNGGEDGIDASVLDARVRLFAPATGGMAPSGLSGYLMRVLGGIPAIQTFFGPLIATSPMLRQLEKRDGSRLESLQTRTEDYASRLARSAFVAHVVFGEQESLVDRDVYACDEVAMPVPGRNHWTVCKPRFDYLYPLEFVIYGRPRRRIA
jgi:hypothetical protein